MAAYAQGTAVPIDRSKSELERVLQRFGAEKFAYFSEPTSAAIAFQVRGRGVRMRITLPDPEQFSWTERGKPRSPEAARREWEAAARSKWRSLVLVVKAKLVAVEDGIATFEDEWLAYLVLPGGRTVGERLVPQLQLALDGGESPAFLLGLEKRAPS